MLRINGDKIEKLVDRSAYDELEKSLALRTFEESGNYVVEDFQITMRENLNDGFNNGVYEVGDTTAQGNTAIESNYVRQVEQSAKFTFPCRGSVHSFGYRTRV